MSLAHFNKNLFHQGFLTGMVTIDLLKSFLSILNITTICIFNIDIIKITTYLWLVNNRRTFEIDTCKNFIRNYFCP